MDKHKARAPMLEKFAQWLADYRLPLAAALLLLALVLGFIGHAKYFAAQGENETAWDDFYYTLRMVNPAATPLQGQLNVELYIARVLAAVAALYIAAEALVSIFRDQVQALRLRSIRNHVVICGLGQKGLLLTDSYRARGINVVVIERDEDNQSITHCKDRGAIVITGNAADPQMLARARAGRAMHVIAVCGNDGVNTEIALYVRQLVGENKQRTVSCIAHIVDLKLWSFLREREMRMAAADAFRLSFFNIYDTGSRVVLRKYPPFDVFRPTTPPPHIMVIGAGRMGERLIANAARLWRDSNPENERLRITLVDKDAKKQDAALKRACPQLAQVCELHPLEIDVTSPDFEPAVLLETGAGITCAGTIYICLGDESAALATTLKLKQHPAFSSAAMIVRMHTAGGLTPLLRQLNIGRNAVENTHAFPLLEETCTPDLIWGGSSFEILAQSIHEDYIRKAFQRGETPDTNRSMAPWNELPDSLKESNRNQAEHISEKLHELGYDYVVTSDWDPALVEFSPAEVEQMSRMEHTRFVNERLRAGWRYGKEKNEQAKTSPTLISYDELSEEEKDKDRNTVRGIPGFMARAGFQIYRLPVKGPPA